MVVHDDHSRGVPRADADVCLALGANLGNRGTHLQSAVDALTDHPSVRVMAVAPCYESDAVGGPADQPPYLNAVLRIATILTPSELLTLIHDIETALGRRRTTPNAPRAIDLDILLYDDRILDSASLTIPHPRMSDRAFVLRPLADIAPDRRHPILHQSIGELLVALGPEALQSCHPVAFALRIPSRAPR